MEQILVLTNNNPHIIYCVANIETILIVDLFGLGLLTNKIVALNVDNKRKK